MLKALIPVALFGAALAAQADVQTSSYRIPGTDTWISTSVGPVTRSAISRDGGETWIAQNPVDTHLHIRFGTFDPKAPPAIPADLTAAADSRLFIVQFRTQIVGEFRAGVKAAGAELHHYLPSQSYLVRMDRAAVAKVAALPYVRAVADYHPAYRLEPEILADLGRGASERRRYNIVVVDKRNDPLGLEAALRQHGAVVHIAFGGGIVAEASMSPAQLRAVVKDDRVLWVDRWSMPEQDIDQARIQAGVNYIETMAGIDGKGMRGHILEGIHATHTEFGAIAPYRTAPISIGDGASSSHGTNTAGEIYARGASALYKGLLPFAQLMYTNYNYVYSNSARYGLTKDLVDPGKTYHAMIQTASWGYPQTPSYTSRSAEMDDIIFDLDLFVTQSQSNTGNTSSRPQAWAKNICSVGGFRHGNNSNPADDYWGGGGSTGPAADGRIGVTLTAYYDSIRTTSGSSSYSTSFGGTSGATPIVNGLGGNMIQMFTEGMFGYGKAPSWQQRHLYLPHFSTTKALLVATAKQLTFNSSGTSTGANRYQQGFGFPSVSQAYDERDRMLVIDELDVLAQGQARTYFLWTPGSREFHAALQYPDPTPAANASIHRINSVDLAVKTAGGASYWGNNGLLSSNYSSTGGAANDRDTEESVIIRSVPAGLIEVTVRATGVRQDGHVETAAMDIDYALVVRGVGGLRDRSGMELTATTGGGTLSLALTKVPSTGWTHGYTLFSRAVKRPISTGNVLGVEFDDLAYSLTRMPAVAGDLFHFVPTTAQGQYPNAAFVFPAPVVAAIKGLTLDGVAFLFDAQGAVVDASNVERFTVQ